MQTTPFLATWAQDALALSAARVHADRLQQAVRSVLVLVRRLVAEGLGERGEAVA